MSKLLRKKMNKKGFTLIELIVVIAILGILAAIAIPRFGGFTDKAKIAADEQYAALVGNALAVQLASGAITIDADTDYTITQGADRAEAATISPAVTGLDTLVKPVPLQKYSTIVITLKTTGDWSIKSKA